MGFPPPHPVALSFHLLEVSLKGRFRRYDFFAYDYRARVAYIMTFDHPHAHNLHDNTSKQCCAHEKRLCPVVQLLVDCFLFTVTAPISFDDPPQTETLNHLTANRAKVPQKRPPSKVLHSILSHSHKSLNMFKSCFFFTEATHCTFIDGRFSAVV